MFACNRKTDVDLADDVAMSTLGQRLKECRKEKGLRQAEVCLRIGIKQGTLSELENDKYPTSSFVPRLAALYGVEAIWLSDGKGPKVRTYGLQDVEKATPSEKIGTPIIAWEKPEDLPEGEFVIVPRYDIHVAAGNGHVVYDELEHEQGQAYRSSSVRSLATSAKNLMTVYAKGESMEPSIYEGDALLVDRGQTTVKDRQVYILRYGHEIRVKRLFLRPDGGLRIVSDNASAFPEEVITADDMKHIEIIGRVVERSGRM